MIQFNFSLYKFSIAKIYQDCGHDHRNLAKHAYIKHAGIVCRLSLSYS